MHFLLRIVSSQLGLEEEGDERLDQAAAAFALLLEQAEDEAELVASFTANLPEVEQIGPDRQLAGEVYLPSRKSLTYRN